MAGLIEKGNAEAQPTFEEAMRAAEAEAGVPSDAELYGEFMAAPEADEAGRVPASREEAAEETPAEAPAEEPVAEEPAEEEAAPAPEPDPLGELQAKIDEQNRKIGQMANENAELRRWQEQQMAQQQSYQPQPDPQSLAWFDEIVDQAPDQAAVWAAQQQQPLLYERAIRSWFDVDPVAAARYERNMEWNQLQAQMQAQIAPQLQGAQELHANAERQAAMDAVRARHDDFDQVMNNITNDEAEQILIQGLPQEVLPVILNGTREGSEKALETLYAFRKAAMTPAMVQGAVDAVNASKEEARQAKREATVASTNTVAGPSTVEETENERLWRVWKEQSPSMRDHWKRG